MLIKRLIDFITGKFERNILKEFLLNRKKETTDKFQYYSNLEKQPYGAFLSFTEIVGLLVLPLIALYMLFPREDLNKYLFKSKEINIELSIKYIRALIDASPTSQERELYRKALIDKYLYIGRFDNALLEIENLKNDGYSEKEVAKLKYQIIKRMYFANKTTKENLQEAFNDLYQAHKNDLGYTKFLLSESLSLGFNKFYKQVVEDLISSKGTIDKYLFYKLLDLSLAYSDYNTGKKLINTFGYRFIRDREAQIKMIKYLLAAGDSIKAAELARKVVENP